LHHGVPGVEDGARLHDVAVEPDSRLAAALGASTVTVSSHHHQAVTRVGPSTRLVARAPDGVVEGVELAERDAPWVVGVQWHPEDTAADDPAQQQLFDTFVAQCTHARRLGDIGLFTILSPKIRVPFLACSADRIRSLSTRMCDRCPLATTPIFGRTPSVVRSITCPSTRTFSCAPTDTTSRSIGRPSMDDSSFPFGSATRSTITAVASGPGSSVT